MVPSPRLTIASSRARLLAPPLLLAAFALAGMLALATTGGWGAHAAGQPALTVSIKSGTATTTTYTVVAANFPANAAITETFGDGSLISPATGQTDGSGGMTRYWMLDVTNKYCGTITAKTDTAQASASFWVAPSTDSQSGTSCDGGTGAAASPTAAATVQATAAATDAPTQASIAQPTTAPAAGSGSGGLLQQLLGSRLLLLVAGGAVALVVIILLVVVASTMLKSGQRKGSSRGGQSGAWNGGWNAPPSRQAAPGWRQPAQGGAPRGQPYGPAAGPRHEPPQGRPQQAPYTPSRMAGAGPADSRWRILDDEDREGRQGTPDPRWSRSQPGARGGHGPGGEGTQARIRTLRDFTEQRQSVRPPSRENDGWR